MKIQCEVCGNIFPEEKAHCEDWRDSEKSFGCPKCKTFLIKPMVEFNLKRLFKILLEALSALVILYFLLKAVEYSKSISGIGPLFVYTVFLVPVIYWVVKNPAAPKLAKRVGSNGA